MVITLHAGYNPARNYTEPEGFFRLGGKIK